MTVKTLQPEHLHFVSEKAVSGQQLLEYAKDLTALYESEKEKRESLESANEKLQQEIAHRLKLADELTRSEEKYRSLFENAHDAIFVTTRDGTLVDANIAYLELFGLDRESFRGDEILAMYVEPSQRAFLKSQVELFGIVRDFELPLRKKDGTVMHCVVTVSVRRDKEGTVLGYQGLVRDVTEEVRSREVLHQARKMEALARMAGAVAHEIRNPLAISSSAAQLLMDDYLPGHLRKECAEKIVSGLNRASLIVENLLDFARPMDRCELRKLDVVSMVRSTLDTVVRTAGTDSMEVVARLCKERLSVQGNLQLLKRAFLNLLASSLDAAMGQARLLVAVERHGNEALVTIGDTLHAAAGHAVDMAFDPCVDAFPGAGGAGLGLSVACAVIHQHGGSIRRADSMATGTMFRVSLPLLPQSHTMSSCNT